MISSWIALAILTSTVVALSGAAALDDVRGKRVVGFSVRYQDISGMLDRRFAA